MTAQDPERLIIAGKEHQLFADPLYRLLKRARIDIEQYMSPPSSACWRCYCGTWEIIDGQLYLIRLERDDEPIPPDLRRRLLKAAGAEDFPVRVTWFSGRFRIAIGPRLIYSHRGWSHWFERERVIAFKDGRVTRDREVDTRAMLERYLRRRPELERRLTGKEAWPGIPPLIWLDRAEKDRRADLEKSQPWRAVSQVIRRLGRMYQHLAWRIADRIRGDRVWAL